MGRRRSIQDIFDDLDEDWQTDEIFEYMGEILDDVSRAHHNAILGLLESCAIHRPAYEVESTNSGYRITIDLPYTRPEDINIHLRENVLFVTAVTQKQVRDRAMEFRLVLPLSRPVIKDASRARFVNGKLRIELAVSPKETHLSAGRLRKRYLTS